MPRLFLFALVLLAAAPAAAQPVIDAVNASQKTPCAEEDNIYVKLEGQGVGALRIEARHPVYLGTMAEDRTAADFTDCQRGRDPQYRSVPRKVTLFEDERIRLVGHALPFFWRPTMVPVRVGAREEQGLQLLQLIRKERGAAIEILVLYPTDGYWRAKPLPPPSLPDTAYGSSFLIGPIEEDRRPLVALTEIAFDPAALTFRLRFAAGGGAMLRVAEIGDERLGLDVVFDRPMSGLFAALRSMMVAPDNADVSEAAWRDAPDAPWQRRPILDFDRVRASELLFGRTLSSRHNTSAPDTYFGAFAGASR